MKPIFLLTVRQLSSRWRLLLLILLALLPIVLAYILTTRAGGEADFGEGFINALIDGMIFAAILPIVMMVLATVAFGHEVEDRTLSYLVLKPLPRSRIVLPKLLASIAIGGPLVIAGGVIATLLGPEGSGQAALAIGVALFAGVVTYAAIFTWAGLISSHALGFAVVYVFLWEGLLSTFVGGIRYLSVRGYSLALLHGIDEESYSVLSDRVIAFPAAWVGAAAVTSLFFLLTVRRLRRMDVP